MERLCKQGHVEEQENEHDYRCRGTKTIKRSAQQIHKVHLS